jgi:hypothetical protein
MELDLYKKIVDEAKDYVFDINLVHRGESLLHLIWSRLSPMPKKWAFLSHPYKRVHVIRGIIIRDPEIRTGSSFILF